MVIKNNTFCTICKKGIYRKPYQFKNNKNFYCSIDCQIKGKTGLSSYIRTEEHRRKQAEKKLGKNNPHWYDKDVGYHGIHSWVRRNKSKPLLCENCNEKKPYDLANISGEYKRDLNDYKWLCRKCHMVEDGRLESLKKVKRKCKLTEENVLEIKKLLLDKLLSQRNIAEKFNVDKTTISYINTGKSWNNIKINNQNEKEVLI